MRPATSANGTPCGSTSPTSTTSDCGSCSNATCCRATRGCSRCRVAAPTWATACCAPTGRRGRDLKALWPELLARPALREILGARAPRGRTGARVADPDALRPGAARERTRAVRRRRRGRGRSHDRRRASRRRSRPACSRPMSIATGGDADAVAARYRRSVGRTLGRDLRFASALQTMLRSSARRTRRDRGRRSDALDAPQLRPLDVRGLSPRPDPHAGPLAPGSVLGAGRVRDAMMHRSAGTRRE